MSVKAYAKFLLIMAGLGGLLYGVDVGVIAAALPYIERTLTFDQDQIGWIVGMALWGSLPSSLVAGLLAEFFGRKKMIVASALLFLVSIPVICASGFFEGGNFWMMVGGRAMQGAAAGLFGVIAPTKYAYDKVIMLAGGVGYGTKRDCLKKEPHLQPPPCLL